MTALVGHSQNSGLGAALPLIERIKPPVWVALDPDPAHAAAAAQHTQLVMRRHHAYDFGEGNVRADTEADLSPDAAALAFVQDCRRQGWYPWAWGVMTPPAMATPSSPPDVLPWAIAFQAACVRMFANDGKECFVCNVPTGNDGYHVPGARWYIAQEYWWDWDHRHFYRRWFSGILAQQPDARLLMGECGRTALLTDPPLPADGGAPHGSDVGWRGGYGIPGIEAGQYAAELAAYAQGAQADPYVIGLAVYGAGQNWDWDTFGVLGVAEIEDVMAATVGDTGVTVEQFAAWGQVPATEPEPEQQQQEVTMPEYVLGFADLADRLGRDVVGNPTANEATLKNPDGSVVLAVQPTDAPGLMFWVPGGQPVFLPGKA